MNHSQMLEVRRKTKRAQKDRAVEAKQAKKSRNRSAKTARADAPKSH